MEEQKKQNENRERILLMSDLAFEYLTFNTIPQDVRYCQKSSWTGIGDGAIDDGTGPEPVPDIFSVCFGSN